MKNPDPNVARLNALNQRLVNVLLAAAPGRNAASGQFTEGSSITARALRRAWAGAALAPRRTVTPKQNLIAALRAKL